MADRTLPLRGADPRGLVRRVGSFLRGVDLARLVPRVVRVRYARKFAVALLVAVLVTSAVGAVTYLDVRDSLDDQVRQQVTSTAELQADGLDEWIANKRTQTRAISAAWQFQIGNSRAVSSHLFQRASTLDGETVAIHYVELDSGVVAESTHGELEGQTAASLGFPWERLDSLVASETDPSVVHAAPESVRSPVNGERAMVFASRPPETENVAVLVTVSLPARMERTQQTMAGAQTTLYDGSGAPIVSTGAASGEANATHADLAGSARFRTAENGDAVAYVPLESVDWVVANRVPESSAYAVRDGVGRSLLLTVLAAVGTLGIAAAVVGRRTTRTLSTLTEEAEQMADGELDASLETRRVDEFGRLYGAFDEMRLSLKESLGAAESFNERLEARADEYREVMDRCAGGDLACRMDPDAESEAMADIARTYNRTMDELGAVVCDAQRFSGDVEAASERASASLTEIRRASEDVSDAATGILGDAVRQDDHLDDVVERTNEFSAATEQMTASAAAVATAAREAERRGERGRGAAKDAVAELREIESATETTVSEVNELEAAIAEIEDVVGFIDDVAEQTNILALNANIEAARAGEAGEGFAVVAEEVKQLAEETRDATADIESSIERVRAQTETTAADIRRTRRHVAEGSDTVEEAMDALESIVDDVAETSTSVAEIREATERQAEATTEVVSMVEDVSDISDRTSSAAEEAAAATEEQTASLTAVDESLGTLADDATELRAALDRFDVTGEPTGEPTDEPTDDAAGGAAASDSGDGAVGPVENAARTRAVEFDGGREN